MSPWTQKPLTTTDIKEDSKMNKRRPTSGMLPAFFMVEFVIVIVTISLLARVLKYNGRTDLPR